MAKNKTKAPTAMERIKTVATSRSAKAAAAFVVVALIIITTMGYVNRAKKASRQEGCVTGITAAVEQVLGGSITDTAALAAFCEKTLSN